MWKTSSRSFTIEIPSCDIKMKNRIQALLPVEAIEGKILLIRGQKVMLDSDLAELYGVTTKRLNEQVRRNSKRFPADFMFCLNEKESQALRSHFATSKVGRGGRRYLPMSLPNKE